MLRSLAKTFPNLPHPSEKAAGIFIITLAAKTDHSFDASGVDLQRLRGVAAFARFGKLLEKRFAAAVSVDGNPRVRQQPFRHCQPNEKFGRRRPLRNRPPLWLSELGPQPAEGPVANRIGLHAIGARRGFETLVERDARTLLEHAPKQFVGLLLAPDPTVKIGGKEGQALIGVILQLPRPFFGPFQRLCLARMVEAQLCNAEIVIRGRQVLGADGDNAVDITLPFGKAFKNSSERMSRTELIVLSGRSRWLYFLPSFARKPAMFSEPRVSQDILVGLARAVEKLPLRIDLTREQRPCNYDRTKFFLAPRP